MVDAIATVAELRGHLQLLFAVSVLAVIVFSVSAISTAHTAWCRYQPQRPWKTTRTRANIVKGRKAWALALVFAGFALSPAFRVYVMATNPAQSFNVGRTVVEAILLVAGLFLLWAFRGKE